jgi:hypothetical protein
MLTPDATHMGLELTMLVVIGTNCIGSCKSNYHTITTTTAHRPYVFINIDHSIPTFHFLRSVVFKWEITLHCQLCTLAQCILMKMCTFRMLLAKHVLRRLHSLIGSTKQLNNQSQNFTLL